MITAEQLQPGIEHLAGYGLNLFASFALDRLPSELLAQIPARSDDRSLILIGHAGPRLWRQIQAWEANSGDDPIDRFSIEKSRDFARMALGGAAVHVHYPGEAPIGLQQLGALAGWHHPSPMGIGINHRWGPWFAYRVVLTTGAELAEIRQDCGGGSPCTDCATAPCIKGCPAGATHPEKGLHLERCAQYRLREHSSCAHKCLARQSCPVGRNARYSDEQINYHYRLSLQTLQRFYGIKV